MVPLKQLPVRTAQVTRAARPVLVTAGGTFSGFLASLGGPDATDGSWEAVYVESYAPVGGILATKLLAYLQAAPMSLSASAAAAQVAAIWATALSIAP